MGYKPKKWPSYALEALEDSVAVTLRIESLCREAQQAIVAGEKLEAMLIHSDIRVKAAQIRENIIRAKSGEYGKGG